MLKTVWTWVINNAKIIEIKLNRFYKTLSTLKMELQAMKEDRAEIVLIYKGAVTILKILVWKV